MQYLMQEDMLNVWTVLPKYIAAQLGLQTLKSDTEQLPKGFQTTVGKVPMQVHKEKVRYLCRLHRPI